MRIHFVSLQAESYPLTTSPLAIITLGAFMRSRTRDVSVTYTDLQHGDLDADLLPELEAGRPDIIGVSAQYGTLPQVERVLDRLRSEGWFGRSCVVAGNVLPTYAYPALLERYPDLLCCVGRGELMLLHLVSQLAKGTVDPARIPGCAWSEGGEARLSDASRFELELLPPADWDGLFARYSPELYEEVWVEASRGCPHKKGGWGCTYCAIMPDAGSRDWRARSEDSVLSELSVLARHGVSHIRFADEEWMADQPERALTFADALYGLRRELLGDEIPMPTFDLAMRVDDVIRRNRRGADAGLLTAGAHAGHKDNRLRIDALRRLRATGLKQIYLGVESGAAGQLKRYYKGVRPEDNELALNALRDLDIQAACGWIMFDPMVTPAEIQENVAFVRRNALLPTTPADSFVTYPLSRMRPLEGSPSVRVLRDANLLGPRTTNLVEYEARYADPAIAAIVHEVEEWERGIPRPALYALKNRIARMAWQDDRLSQEDKALADLYFTLKRLDLDLADQLTRAILNDTPETALPAIRLHLEQTRTALTTRVRELANTAP